MILYDTSLKLILYDNITQAGSIIRHIKASKGHKLSLKGDKMQLTVIVTAENGDVICSASKAFEVDDYESAVRFLSLYGETMTYYDFFSHCRLGHPLTITLKYSDYLSLEEIYNELANSANYELERLLGLVKPD